MIYNRINFKLVSLILSIIVKKSAKSSLVGIKHVYENYFLSIISKYSVLGINTYILMIIKTTFTTKM